MEGSGWQEGPAPAPSRRTLTEVGAVGDDKPLLPALQTCGDTAGASAPR